MKQVKVNEKCSGCGLCIANCAYLQENVDGNAEPILGKVIADNDVALMNKVVKDCPEQALYIVESDSKAGKAGLDDAIKQMKNIMETFSVKRVKVDDIKLKGDDYYIPVPYSSKDRRYDYSSESQAKSAARDEFRRLCYSESAYKPIIKKVFVEYKVKYLKPYYTCTATEESVYYKYNKEVEKCLAEVFAKVISACGGEKKLPESWMKFSVYPNSRDIMALDVLEHFDMRSDNSGIMTDFRNSYATDIDTRLGYLDYDYEEVYEGSGFFGDKYKKKWGFSGFDDEAKTFIEDLKRSINCMGTEITEGAVQEINYALEKFEKMVKDELKKKCNELEKLVG